MNGSSSGRYMNSSSRSILSASFSQASISTTEDWSSSGIDPNTILDISTFESNKCKTNSSSPKKMERSGGSVLSKIFKRRASKRNMANKDRVISPMTPCNKPGNKITPESSAGSLSLEETKEVLGSLLVFPHADTAVDSSRSLTSRSDSSRSLSLCSLSSPSLVNEPKDGIKQQAKEKGRPPMCSVVDGSKQNSSRRLYTKAIPPPLLPIADSRESSPILFDMISNSNTQRLQDAAEPPAPIMDRPFDFSSHSNIAQREGLVVPSASRMNSPGKSPVPKHNVNNPAFHTSSPPMNLVKPQRNYHFHQPPSQPLRRLSPTPLYPSLANNAAASELDAGFVVPPPALKSSASMYLVPSMPPSLPPPPPPSLTSSLSSMGMSMTSLRSSVSTSSLSLSSLVPPVSLRAAESSFSFSANDSRNMNGNRNITTSSGTSNNNNRNSDNDRSRSKLIPNKNHWVEIAPGFHMPLRGAHETWAYVKQGRMIGPFQCVSCETYLHAMDDAECVLCPNCRVVLPLQEDDGSRDGNCLASGVALGFTHNDYCEWKRQGLL